MIKKPTCIEGDHEFKPKLEYDLLVIGKGRMTMGGDVPIRGSIYCATCGLVYIDTANKHDERTRKNIEEFKTLNGSGIQDYVRI